MSSGQRDYDFNKYRQLNTIREGRGVQWLPNHRLVDERSDVEEELIAKSGEVSRVVREDKPKTRMNHQEKKPEVPEKEPPPVPPKGDKKKGSSRNDPLRESSSRNDPSKKGSSKNFSYPSMERPSRDDPQRPKGNWI